MKRTTLVIGIGNDVRGDDGVGPEVARRLAKSLDDADVRLVHQLTTELAMTLTQYDTVVFIDADTETERVRITPVRADAHEQFVFFHWLTPTALITITEALFNGTSPRALLVSIPARSFSFGTSMSPEAASCIEESVLAAQDYLLLTSAVP